MLSLAPGVEYIHEPFNPRTPPGVCAADFERYFMYLTRRNEASYYPHLARTLRFSYNWRAQAQVSRSLREARCSLGDGLRFARARATRARPLMKDPLALVSSEWLADRFGMAVVIMIRHPAAFVSSIKKLNWRYAFEDFLSDRALMADHLASFEAELEAQVRRPGDVVSQAILTWRVLYSIVASFRRRHADWTYLRHEDLSRAPTREFSQLYQRLGLRFTEHVRNEIEEYSGSRNPTEIASAYSIRVDSAENIWNWQTRLSRDEIQRIRRDVEDVSHHFYADDDWIRTRSDDSTDAE